MMLAPRYTATATLTGLSNGSLTFGLPNAGLVLTLAPFFKGDKGDPGTPGANGAGFDYVQISPSDTWTIAHNLGFRPSVATFTPGGLEMMGTVQHLSTDVLQITFSQPVAGTARLN